MKPPPTRPPRRHAADPRVGRDMLTMLREARRCYCRALRRCRRRPTPKRVHRFRSDARRLLTVLRLVQAVTAAGEIAAACRLVGRQLKSLGDLRDLHVQTGHLAALEDGPGEVHRLARRLRRRARRLARESGQRSRLRCHRRTWRVVEALVASLVGPPADERNWRLAAAMVTRQAAESALRCRPAISAGPSIHHARIALRELRLTAELVAGALPVITDEQLGSLHRCQDLMGEIHDLELLVALLGREGAGRPRRARRLGPLLEQFGRRRAELGATYEMISASTFDPEEGPVAKLRRGFAPREGQGTESRRQPERVGPSERIAASPRS